MRISILAVAAIVCTWSSVEADEIGQSAQHLKTTIPVEMGYQLYLPDDYANKESWPLVLFLHGSGERGDNLELVKKHGPPRLIRTGSTFRLLSFRRSAQAEFRGSRFFLMHCWMTSSASIKSIRIESM